MMKMLIYRVRLGFSDFFPLSWYSMTMLLSFCVTEFFRPDSNAMPMKSILSEHSSQLSSVSVMPNFLD